MKDDRPRRAMDNPRPARPRPSKMVRPSMLHDTPVSLVFRHIEPSWRDYVIYARRASEDGDESMAKFMKIFDALPRREQASIMPEKVCSLADVREGELIGAVSRYYWQEKQGESVMLAALQHPRMLQATAFWGQTLAACSHDRELFFRMTGALPDRKGSAIVINNHPTISATALSAQSGPPAAGGPSNGFRPMAERVIEMGRVLDQPDQPFNRETARVLAADHREED